MSDYSQILKRETETNTEKKPDKKEEVSDIKNVLKEKQADLFDPAKISDKSVKKQKSKSRKSIPVWISLSDAAKICGIQSKTIRRAIKAGKIKYKIIHNRYLVEFESLMLFLALNKKLKNKFKQFGIGQYISSWKTGYKL